MTWQPMETVPAEGEVLLWVVDMPSFTEPTGTGPVHVIIEDGDYKIAHDADANMLSYWTHGPILGWMAIPSFESIGLLLT